MNIRIKGTRYYVADMIVAVVTLALCVGMGIGAMLL